MERRALLRALGAAGALSLAGCADRPGGGEPTPTDTDSRTPTPTPGDPDPASETPSGGEPTGEAVRWTRTLGGPAADPPTLAEDTLYVAGGANGQATPPNDSPVGPESSQSLFAFGTDGTERWRDESNAAIQGRPVVADGAVHAVVGWSSGYTGLDTRVVRVEGGDRVWESTPRDSFLSILGSEDGTLFVGTSDDAIGLDGETLFAVRPDGSLGWSREAGDAFEGAVADGTLYLDYGDRQTVAFDTSDGTERWVTDRGVPGPLAVYDDTLYLDSPTENASGDYPVVAVDAATGEARWSYAADVERFVATGAVEAAESVFVTEYDGLLVALDPADGEERWRYDAGAETTEPPTVHDGTVYLPSEGSLHAVDAASGEARWTRSVGAHVWGAYPSDAGVVVRARTGTDRTVLAGLAPDGTERWRFEGVDLTRPAVSGLRAYVATGAGYVAALGP